MNRVARIVIPLGLLLAGSVHAEVVGNDPDHSAPVGDNVPPGSPDTDGDVLADLVDVCPNDGAPGYQKPEAYPGDEIFFAPGLSTGLFVVSVDAATPEENGTVTIQDCATDVVLNYGDFYWTQDRQYTLWLGRIFVDRGHFVVWNHDANNDGFIDCGPQPPPAVDACVAPCSGDSLLDWVNSLVGVPPGIQNSLATKLQNYLDDLAAGNQAAADARAGAS